MPVVDRIKNCARKAAADLSGTINVRFGSILLQNLFGAAIESSQSR
jgi:hypothetical protein